MTATGSIAAAQPSPDEGTTDAQLIERFTSAGDGAAFAALVRRHLDMVYAAARRQSRGNDAQASDITQVVFVLLYRKARHIPGERLAGWLYLTTQNVAANARKAAARRLQHEARAAMQAQQTQNAIPADVEPLGRQLDPAIASLGKTDRELIIRHYLQRVPVAALSTDLNLAEPTCRKRLSRAVEKLRDYFARRGVNTSRDLIVSTMAGWSLPCTPDAVLVVAVQSPSPSASASLLLRKVTMNNIKAITLKSAAVAVVCVGTLGIALATDGSIPSEEDSSTVAPPRQLQAAPATAQAVSELEQTQMNLKLIGICLELYSRANGEKMPTLLSETALYSTRVAPRRIEGGPGTRGEARAANDSWRIYLSPRDQQTTHIPPNAKPDWIDQHTSYLYLGRPVVAGQALPGVRPQELAVVHEKLGDARRVSVLFLDGHVRTVDKEEAEEVIAASRDHWRAAEVAD